MTLINHFFNKNLRDDNNNLYYKGLAVPTVVDFSEISFVAQNGNDATALRGRMDRPYQTITAACKAAYINQYSDPKHTVYVLSGKYRENVQVDKHIQLMLEGVVLESPNANPAIEYLYGGYGNLVLHNSMVTSNNANPTISASSLNMVGRGMAYVGNSGTGSALHGGANTIEGVKFANYGASDKPALYLVDGRLRNVQAGSVAGFALHQRRVNVAHSLFENCSFLSDTSYGVYGESSGVFQNCQIRSKATYGMVGGDQSYLRLLNCRVFSDVSAAFMLTGQGNPHFQGTAFVGATHAIYAPELTLGHHQNSENNYARFDTCEFYAGTGSIFNVTFSIYDWPGTKRIIVAHSRMNKAYSFNDTGYLNPKSRFTEQNNMTLAGMVNPHEWIAY